MSELAQRLIAENIKTKEPRLDLGNCGLTELPEGLAELEWVEELILGDEWWEFDIEKKQDFQKKSQNNGKPNQFQKLPLGQSLPFRLKKLVFSNTEINSIEALAVLNILQELYCDNNQIIDLSPIENLTNLQRLDCFHNQINDLSPIENLMNLQQLDCNNNQITDLNPIASLTTMQLLFCYNNQIDDLSPIANLTNLQLISCDNNQIADLSPVANLTNLQKISCDNNKIADLSPVAKLTNLQLIFCDNNKITTLRPLLPLLKRGLSLYVEDNPLTNPPPEIAAQGNAAILKYFEQTATQSQETLLEAKIVVVGAGESGKTTLIRKLQNPAHPVPNAEDKRTEGVQVTPLDLDKSLNGRQVRAHLWDLGGQELYHSTHQFFLTPDTFYILLNDNRKNDTDFYYWLNVLALRAGDACPVFCIFNQKENATRQISLDDHLFGLFPGLLPSPEDVDFADPEAGRFELLRKTIEGHFLTLPVLQKAFPAFWVNVRDALAEIKVPYISWQQFTEVCIAEKISEDDTLQMEIVAQTLHNLGNLLWYPQVFGMKQLLFLNPQWCLDAMYKVLDSKPVQTAQGRFDQNLLAQMWADPAYAERQLQLEQLMRHFDLCYETAPGTGQYIAPQLLALEAKPPPEFPKQGSIVFKHKYEFMPAGLLSRFIARMARHIHGDYVWRKGVALRWENDTIGEAVENPLEREITLRACGPDRKRRMDEMRKTLETVESLFRGLKLTRLLSCNCPDCLKATAPTVFDLSEVEDFAQHNEDLTCRKGSRKKVAARHILEGIEYRETPRIFISYAHKNELYKDEFREMIAPMERSGQWEVWDDRYLLPGDEWNAEIIRQIAEANVIVLLLTPSFFNSNYIYDIELTRAIERHENGSALVVGVVVADCMYEETPLSRVQVVPKDALPVERHPNRPEVWKSVAKKIKEAIAAREQRREMGRR